MTVWNALAQIGRRDVAIAPDALNADQQEMWDLTKPHEYAPSGDQTPEQAFHFAAESFKQACWFDGVEPPSDEVIYAEIDRLRREAGSQRPRAA